jgi:DNA-binding response OmpR family regulator
MGGSGSADSPTRRRRRPRATPLPSRLRVATIDRDRGFLKVLSEHTTRMEWSLIVHSGPVSPLRLLDGDPHAVLVDIGVLGPHWEDWLAHHPMRVPRLGVVVCTGRSTALQRVRGLRAGADDWITKPCHPEEVCARLQAIVRALNLRALREDSRPLRGGELELRTDLYDALAAGRPAGLTRREFDLLAHLVRRRGEPIGRERLYRAVWGFEMARGDRSIDTFVRKIRGKLREVSPGWRYVHTNKGVGYSFKAERAGGNSAQE